MHTLPWEIAQVPRVVRPSADDFRALVASHRPAVLVGCLDHWKLLERLEALGSDSRKLDHLRDILGDTRVGYSVIPAERGGQFALTDELKQEFHLRAHVDRFGDFADRLQASLENPALGTVYLQSLPLSRLRSAFDRVPFTDGFRRVAPEGFWIGSGGQVVNLHYDPHMNTICMLSGSKRVMLLPPTVLPNLYPAPPDRTLADAPTSLVRASEPDFAKFPKFRSALESACVTELKPGEVLLIPPLWWHHVESYGLNIMVNSWFHHAPYHSVRLIHAALFDAISATAGASDATRAHCRSLFEEKMTPGRTAADLPHAMTAWQRHEMRSSIENIHYALASIREADRAALWRSGVSVFLDYFAFGVYGEPFPTLPPGELDRLGQRSSAPAARIRRSLAKGANKYIRRPLESCL